MTGTAVAGMFVAETIVLELVGVKIATVFSEVPAFGWRETTMIVSVAINAAVIVPNASLVFDAVNRR